MLLQGLRRTCAWMFVARSLKQSFMQDAPTAADRALLRTSVEKDFTNVASLHGIITKGQKDAWLKLLQNLKNLSLKHVGSRRLGSHNATEANVTYKFHSFDSNQNEGTGTLGSA
eukprot:symbB.v1.2.024298.t1/scaffold2289.1/size83295/6